MNLLKLFLITLQVYFTGALAYMIAATLDIAVTPKVHWVNKLEFGAIFVCIAFVIIGALNFAFFLNKKRGTSQ